MQDLFFRRLEVMIICIVVLTVHPETIERSTCEFVLCYVIFTFRL
jgi:hypothetical protein